ncbi:SUMF1/EgtB/PvdO family nonheme iron enzyme [Bacteroidota bacterium]
MRINFINKVHYLLVFQFLFNSILAQEISNISVVGSAEFLPNEIISNENRDTNGEVCAGLSILSDLTGLSFDSNNGIVKVNQQQPGKSLLYLSPDEQVVTIHCEGFKPLQIILNDYGINLESGKVWKIEITGEKLSDLIPISILTQPPEADIYIDGEYKGTSINHLVSMGTHQVKISKDRYYSTDDTIEVTSDNAYFNYTLHKIIPFGIKINSVPSGARVFVDDIERDQPTPHEDFYFPGTHKISLSKPGFFTLDDNIMVTKAGEEFNFTLEKNAGTLLLKYLPEDANVFVNKRDYGITKSIDLSPGEYLVEIMKYGYEIVNDNVEIILNQETRRNYTLKAITGAFQFTIQPNNASCKLLLGDRTIMEWQGIQYIDDLLIGNYTLECSFPGYEYITEKITIIQDQTIIKRVTLQKQSQPIEYNPSDITNELILVRGGSFQIGDTFGDGDSDEKPPNKVILNDFNISKYEITNYQYAGFLNSTNPSNEKLKNWLDIENANCKIEKINSSYRPKNDFEIFPVVEVSWHGADAFCKWLGGRLPTEAEWEYAARGGIESNGYKYSGSDSIEDVAWYENNSGSTTQIVGTKNPNELEIYDMSGNAWEWCSDWYDENYYSISPTNNPKGPNSGTYRIIRGGSWFSHSTNCRVAVRNRYFPVSKGLNFGFRVTQGF